MKGKKYMTKTKALEQMLEYDRSVIDPQFARKIAKAFGYTLGQLGMKPRKTKDFNRMNYTEETANLSSIAVYELAREIAIKNLKAKFKTDKELLEVADKFKSLSYHNCSKGKKKWLEFYISSPLNGAGSSAQWITEHSVEIIKGLDKIDVRLGCGIHNNYGRDL